MYTPTPLLVIGYGNMDRQDDGVAWHVLASTAQNLKIEFPPEPGEAVCADNGQVEFIFQLQLTPELAETIAQRKAVFFVDAHTGNIPEELQIVKISAGFQKSPFTHHMTPETALSMAEMIYHRAPDAYLCSVRGYEFLFSTKLSERTAALAQEAASQLTGLIKRYLEDTPPHASG